MEQTFECPQCHDNVKPDHLACYSCGLTSDVRPTVITGKQQQILARVQEAIHNSYHELDEVNMNVTFDLYFQELVNGSLEWMREALRQLDKLDKDFR